MQEQQKTEFFNEAFVLNTNDIVDMDFVSKIPIDDAVTSFLNTYTIPNTKNEIIDCEWTMNDAFLLEEEKEYMDYQDENASSDSNATDSIASTQYAFHSKQNECYGRTQEIKFMEYTFLFLSTVNVNDPCTMNHILISIHNGRLKKHYNFNHLSDFEVVSMMYDLSPENRQTFPNDIPVWHFCSMMELALNQWDCSVKNHPYTRWVQDIQSCVSLYRKLLGDYKKRQPYCEIAIELLFARWIARYILLMICDTSIVRNSKIRVQEFDNVQKDIEQKVNFLINAHFKYFFEKTTTIANKYHYYNPVFATFEFDFNEELTDSEKESIQSCWSQEAMQSVRTYFGKLFQKQNEMIILHRSLNALNQITKLNHLRKCAAYPMFKALVFMDDYEKSVQLHFSEIIQRYNKIANEINTDDDDKFMENQMSILIGISNTYSLDIELSHMDDCEMKYRIQYHTQYMLDLI